VTPTFAERRWRPPGSKDLSARPAHAAGSLELCAVDYDRARITRGADRLAWGDSRVRARVHRPGDEHTLRVARAVAVGLRDRAVVGLVGLPQAPTRIGTGVDLLVAGVHDDWASLTCTSDDACVLSTFASLGGDLHEWLDHLHPISPELAVAAFDTSSPGEQLAPAATTIRRLRGLGLLAAVPAETFRVSSVTHLLEPGEESRARDCASGAATAIAVAMARGMIRAARLTTGGTARSGWPGCVDTKPAAAPGSPIPPRREVMRSRRSAWTVPVRTQPK